MKKKIAVVLSGCGVKDGSEIHEAVITLLCIDREGAEYRCIAPEILQTDVINHITGQKSMEKRNVLEESARISRGEITDIRSADPSDFDAVIVPGGFGAAKNLSSFAFQGKDCSVQKDFEQLILKFHNAGKPIGAICIAPAVIAKIFENKKSLEITIGKDPGTASAIKAMGHEHIEADASGIAWDRANRIVTTPAYMMAKSISEAETGIAKLVKKIIEIA
jgi:enhancing lycopene biosynthesis protein 2